ncbi:MAG: hypothetical protein F6K41_44095 [Symploca sp. SIO3E6]|nr:hypothetical protein [Caldora sp. SIO3E6]
MMLTELSLCWLLMEPLEIAVAALIVQFLTKAGEKAGETFGEKLFDQGTTLFQRLRRKSPQTVAAIEQAEEAPLDFGQAVLEVKAAAETEPDIAEAVQQIGATVTENSQLAEAMQKVIEEMKSSPSAVQNSGKLAEKINALFQGTTISGGNVGNTQDFQNSTSTGVFQSPIHGNVNF